MTPAEFSGQGERFSPKQYFFPDQGILFGTQLGLVSLNEEKLSPFLLIFFRQKVKNKNSNSMKQQLAKENPNAVMIFSFFLSFDR